MQTDPLPTVEKERVGMIGGWMVASGQLDPDSIESGWLEYQPVEARCGSGTWGTE